MGDFITYPLEQSYFSSFTADVWNCSVPLPQILAMFAASGSKGGSQQVAPTWRPSKPFPPQRFGAPYQLCGVRSLTFRASSQVHRCCRAGGLSWNLQAAYGRVSVISGFWRVLADLFHASRFRITSRVTLTDYRGNVVFDSFVRPT